MNEYNHLIIVCCHAIYIGGSSVGASEDEWWVFTSIYLSDLIFSMIDELSINVVIG